MVAELKDTLPDTVRVTVERLREPVDYGGYDGYGPDQMHCAAVDMIEAQQRRIDEQKNSSQTSSTNLRRNA